MLAPVELVDGVTSGTEDAFLSPPPQKRECLVPINILVKL